MTLFEQFGEVNEAIDQLTHSMKPDGLEKENEVEENEEEEEEEEEENEEK